MLRNSAGRFILLGAVLMGLASPHSSWAQSTATLEGTITDATGAVVPGAKIVVHNVATGEDRNAESDSAGVYLVPSLPVGTYRVNVTASGMQSVVANNIPLEVGRTLQQNFSLRVASSSEVIEVTGVASVVTSETVTVGSVIDQKTVQEIPLNGRHFLDMGFLVPGSVTPPQNAGLAAPLRGQGFFGFNTAGGRDDTINFMMNGINLNDPNNNQITFQPTIATIQEFKVDNSTFSPEYGRNSGAIVNIATRSGTNEWHGEAYEYLRNNDLDARNYTNPSGITMAPFKRNQFGGDGGGAIRKDHTFFYLSYEGLRHRQNVPISTTVLTDAQRALAAATGDATVKKLLPLIPAANSAGGVFVTSAIAPVNIDQGTANVSHSFTDSHRLNVYYALQFDLRNEPPTTQGNNIPGFGDTRVAHRQIMTVNDTKVFSSTLVNEARLGYNRIHITFTQLTQLKAGDFGINNGTDLMPQIQVTGALAFGGINGFPSGRGDYTAVASDTLNWVHGKHSVKFGGEYRRINNNNFSYGPGLFTFPSITAFINDQATGFSGNPSNGSSRIYENALGFFIQDSYRLRPTFMLEIGMRYDWNSTPSEGGNRFVVFDPVADSLRQTSQPYNQSARNFEPRLGFSWDIFGHGKTVVRAAYALQTDQPKTSLVTALATNPPFAYPVSFAPTTSTPFVTFGNAFPLAGGAVSPNSIVQNYKNAYVQSYNFNIQQLLASNLSFMAGYFGNKGTDMNIARNYNQFSNGVRPYASLSPNSPIFPGKPLSNIQVFESDGNSNYNALWLTGLMRISHGLQFNTSYTWSKSLDYNSRNVQNVAVQDSYNLRGDYGLSDYDARHRWVYSGIYDVPLHGNRLKDGWELSAIITLQTGNPITFVTTNRALTGTATVRPSVSGPVQVGFSPATNGNATFVSYVQNPSVFFSNPNGFGNLGRNVIIGPGFSNVDFALIKNTYITERLRWQIRADAFDLLNHANYGQPGTSFGTASFGLITNTRFPPGDSGSSRQLQLAMKLVF
ncbi:MAG TPA: carboxypeptidase regulatory-like domain-containing protein [Bryobacteraceae bacterium]|nr:carboxypeptidase regulatory-like domain-containing protein [Bryobacteraceae bacterium]